MLTQPWTDALRRLAPGFAGDAPWRLVAPEGDLPGFLQAPDPGGLRWKEVVAPDELDVLNTARNHDVKRGINRQPGLEDWVLALVSLQTMAGCAGSGQHGIARMNGGYGSRRLVGLAPGSAGDVTLNASLWWERDVRRLLTERRGGLEPGRGKVGGTALLWCLGWEEEDQVEVETLDPWFIEICRRVRLDDDGGRVVAWTSSSKATRVAAKGLKGDVGDPWAPIHKRERKSFTIGKGHLNHARLCKFLFSEEWELPALARRGHDEIGKDMVLVTEALSRGKGRLTGSSRERCRFRTGKRDRSRRQRLLGSSWRRRGYFSKRLDMRWRSPQQEAIGTWRKTVTSRGARRPRAGLTRLWTVLFLNICGGGWRTKAAESGFWSFCGRQC